MLEFRATGKLLKVIAQIKNLRLAWRSHLNTKVTSPSSILYVNEVDARDVDVL